MNLAATVSFSVKNGKTEDYDTIYKELKKVGLSQFVKGVNEKNEDATSKLPETTVYGTYDRESAEVLREYVRKEVGKAYAVAKVSGEYFVAVGGSSTAWAYNSI